MWKKQWSAPNNRYCGPGPPEANPPIMIQILIFGSHCARFATTPRRVTRRISNLPRRVQTTPASFSCARNRNSKGAARSEEGRRRKPKQYLLAHR